MSDAPDPHKDIDSHTGVETTGHEWDGLKELNNPAPRWWLIVWMLTIVWAIGYWVVYPSWPTLSGHTKGIAGWTQYDKLKHEQAEITQRQSGWLGKFHKASFAEIKQDPVLFEFARAGGEVVFKENCAACHGAGGEGRRGYPNLNDDDWLFGGTAEDIYNTINVGSHSTHPNTHAVAMPAFGAVMGREGMLTPAQIDDVATYVSYLRQPVASAAFTRGQAVFQQNCVSCHGEGGIGNRQMGAPRLNDAIWLYGGDKATLVQTITKGRAGVMPSWQSRMSDDSRRQVAIYVHSLGGGE
ncbi:cytochrome-c oxidase, cbb3-type subunit III [Asticcacaulis excentricus]|uniref:Cbb3-type cytochrome c oxidase subunit n=1 Tax=Asticcacaulis excentricus (strain ATCC 15261 / DSM 4724 / KCTC 12464 / NCIMB 9791 / VKM B-1370 / CB 48) TaxID=573065 RepID=E8RUA0_ASTEC|nr:cytochrome-c oxidase, cbb3-type subunit III [Asticcacaulis excentricus]ADU15071.1 cytochrome c oxidase, cbb3-type, subunit III [Asticcacaulis excentricus CB 48]